MKTVIAKTEVRAKEVYYAVEVDSVIVWERIVRFGKDHAHRAGGYAFVEAAQTQERIAYAREGIQR